MPPGARRLAGPQSSAAHVFVEDLDVPLLCENDALHLARALRLRPGEVVSASDGRGRWRRCVFTGASGSADLGAAIEPDGPVLFDPAPSPAVTVAFSLTKSGGPEWVVQRLTEVGADRMVPVVSSRSVARWEPGRAERRVERLRRVSRQAAMQSRRVWLAEVDAVVGFAELTVGTEASEDAALAEAGGGPPSLGRPMLIVGPEGGWEDHERECGLPLVGLGPTVLRADTAALVAGAVLCALRSRLVAGNGGAAS